MKADQGLHTELSVQERNLIAAVRAAGGMPVAAIGATFWPPLAVDQTRAAVAQGRLALAAAARPRSEPIQHAATEPQTVAGGDGIERLLGWAEHAKGYAPTVALRVRAGLRELAVLRENEGKRRAPVAVSEPPLSPAAVARAYRSVVLAWAASTGRRVPSGKPSQALIEAYEAAHGGDTGAA